METQKLFEKLDEQVENMTETEQNFMLWQLLKKYADRLEIPKKCETIDDYRKEKLNQRLLAACNDLEDMLCWELWM